MTSSFFRTALAALLVASALVPLAVRAQDAAAPPSETLYERLGGSPGLVRLMDDFVPRLLAEPRLQPFFKETDLAHLKKQLVDQFCQVAGGPCRLQGPDMKTAHAAMDISKRDFNALVEVLQQSMDAQGIAFSTQNRLLALLAPMHRDIVNTP